VAALADLPTPAAVAALEVGNVVDGWRTATTASQTVALLNALNDVDNDAISTLFLMRVPCNENLAKLPAVQLFDDAGIDKVGLLGIINGLYGRYRGWGRIGMVTKESKIMTPDGFVLMKEMDIP